MRHRYTRRRIVQTASVGSMGLLLAGCGGSQLVSGPPTPAPDTAAGAAPPGQAALAVELDGLVDYSARFAQYQPADEPNGDLARVVWPRWLLDLDPEIRQLYEFQILNGPLMRYMPCFCGCHVGDGHRSNRNCYIEHVNPDGSVVFDRTAPT